MEAKKKAAPKAAKPSSKPSPKPRPAPKGAPLAPRPTQRPAQAKAGKRPKAAKPFRSVAQAVRAGVKDQQKRLAKERKLGKKRQPMPKARRKAMSRKVHEVKKIIQTADAISLKSLVDVVRQDYLGAAEHFRAMADKVPAAIHQRANQLVEGSGLSPHSAANWALRVAELEAAGAGGGERCIAVGGTLGGAHVTLLAHDESSAQLIRQLLDAAEREGLELVDVDVDEAEAA